MSTGSTSPGSIRRLFRIVSPACEDMTEMISAMLDRKLPLRTQLRMRVHFLYCSYCRRVREHLAFLRRAASLFESDEANSAAEGLGNAEKERMRQALREQP